MLKTTTEQQWKGSIAMKKYLMGWLLGIFVLGATVGVVFSDISGSEVGQGNATETQGAQLDVKFTPTKIAYTVNEPIYFQIAGSKDAYLYIINVSDTSGKATLLFPNQYEGTNKMEAKKEITIPAQKSVFKSDRPGVERVILLASTKELNLQTGKAPESGFPGIEKSIVDNLVKEIKVEPRKDGERMFKVLDIPIVGGAETGTPPQPPVAEGQAKPAVLLSTDKILYGLNENIVIACAADAEGYVALFALNPEGKISLLKSIKVDKNKIYRENGITLPPAGRHHLVGIFTTKEPDKESAKNLVASLVKAEGETKDVRLMDKTVPHAVYAFTIQ